MAELDLYRGDLLEDINFWGQFHMFQDRDFDEETLSPIMDLDDMEGASSVTNGNMLSRKKTIVFRSSSAYHTA